MNMKRTLTLFCLSALVCHSAWALPAKTNDIPITMYSDGGHDFKQFSKRVSGYSDQYFHFHFDQSMTGVSPSFKMSYPPDGSTTNRTTVFSVTTNFTVSTTNITFFVDRTNLVMRPRTYHAELWGDVTATDIGSPLARGKVTITKSLFDQQGDTEAFPVANTDIYTYVSGQLTNTYIPRSLLTTIGDTIWYSNDWRRLPIGDAGQAIGTDDGTNICFITTVGSGDMLAATYDPAVNGIVDTSDAHIAWTNSGVGAVAVTNATLTESTSNAVSVSGRIVAIVVNTNYLGSSSSLTASNLIGNVPIAALTNVLAAADGTNLDWNGTHFDLDAAAQASDDLADSATQPADLAAHTNDTLALGAHGGELDPNYASDSNAILTHTESAHEVNTNGGFQAGTGATATFGAAAGLGADATSGGALGEATSATTGGAVGGGSSVTTGGAIGNAAISTTGGAAGSGASSTTGGAIGDDADATSGFSGGANADGTVDCIQLGTGTNTTLKTLQVYSTQLLDANGNVPTAPMTNNVVAALASQSAAGESNVVTSAGLADIATEIGLANSAMQDLVDDTTPTLGGTLEAVTEIITWVNGAVTNTFYGTSTNFTFTVGADTLYLTPNP